MGFRVETEKGRLHIDIVVLIVAVGMMANVDLLKMGIAQCRQQGVEELADRNCQPALAGNCTMASFVSDISCLNTSEGEHNKGSEPYPQVGLCQQQRVATAVKEDYCKHMGELLEWCASETVGCFQLLS